MTEHDNPEPAGTFERVGPIEASRFQRRAGLATLALLCLAGVWTLHEFIPALLWSVIIAIGIWPLFTRAAHRWPKRRTDLLPALVVLAVVVVFIVPLIMIAVPIAKDAHGAATFFEQVQRAGVPTPPILIQLPYGDRLRALWQANLGQPSQINAISSRILKGNVIGFGRGVFREVFHSGALIGVMLLALFFLLRESHALLAQLRIASRRTFGPAGEHVGGQMIRAVQGTVNGLVLVGLAEGAIMTVAYVAVSAPYVALFGVFTALLAMIPFGATVAFGIAAIVLLAVNKIISAVIVVGVGLVVTFVADHFFRPVLIGNATKLPFLWVLLGILGGITAFGLVGLFVGPAVLAALMLLWREWVGSKPGVLNPDDRVEIEAS